MQNNYILDTSFINSLSSDKNDFYEKYFKQGISGLKKYENGYHLALIEEKYLQSDVSEEYGSKMARIVLKAAEKLKHNIDAAKDKYGEERVALILGITDRCSKKSFNFIKGVYKNLEYTASSVDKCASLLRKYLGICGISFTISNACVSSASAIIRGDELIKSGVCDVAVVGGADVVVDSVFLGFSSLDAVDKNKTIPFSKNRRGINLGEGASLFILAKENYMNIANPIKLKGYYENSDAFHMTSPNTDGIIASKCIEESVKSAGLKISDIDYINLHGTGTELNDKMESQALKILGAENIYASSNKTIFGHTLSAASAMELMVSFLALSDINEDKILPRHIYDGEYDDSINKIKLVEGKVHAEKLENIVNTSFAFGGSNASLVIGR